MGKPLWYLIWSNAHAAWWRASQSGYTSRIEEAGRYSYTDAFLIVDGATVNGQLNQVRTDPQTGRRYVSFDEYMVPAPDLQPWEIIDERPSRRFPSVEHVSPEPHRGESVAPWEPEGR